VYLQLSLIRSLIQRGLETTFFPRLCCDLSVGKRGVAEGEGGDSPVEDEEHGGQGELAATVESASCGTQVSEPLLLGHGGWSSKEEAGL
jgi:hypothetical protein